MNFCDAIERIINAFNEQDDVAVLIHLSPVKGETEIHHVNIDKEATVFLLGKLHQKLQMELSGPVRCQALPGFFSRQ